MQPAVSVVIPTYHRDQTLARCLRSLTPQNLPADRFEILVVDDARSDSAPKVVAGIAAETEIPMRCLTGSGRGPAAARNIGWRAASGEIIAFIDDDAYPERDDWLLRGLSAFDGAEIVAVTGRVIVPVDDPPTDFQRNVKRLEDADFLTCNAFVRRAELEAVGGFDERFERAFREDSDLQFRLEKRGRIGRAGDAVVVHPAPRGEWGVSLKLQRNSMYNALIRRKHPDRVGELGAGPPIDYYGMLGSGVLALGALAAGRRQVAFASGAIGLALWLSFLRRRLSGTSRRHSHVLEMVVTSALIPPLSVYWRLRGAIRFRVLFP